MIIRNACEQDIQEIVRIYEKARAFMKANGNPNQWVDGYPQESVIRKDLKEGNLYVCEKNGWVGGAFSFMIGEEPTYQNIEQGNWHSDAVYGTIHRLASDGTLHGLASQVFTFCLERSRYLRIDTHRDNAPMQHAIRKFGFRECGIIHVANGRERVAFDFIGTESGQSPVHVYE